MKVTTHVRFVNQPVQTPEPCSQAAVDVGLEDTIQHVLNNTPQGFRWQARPPSARKLFIPACTFQSCKRVRLKEALSQTSCCSQEFKFLHGLQPCKHMLQPLCLCSSRSTDKAAGLEKGPAHIRLCACSLTQLSAAMGRFALT